MKLAVVTPFFWPVGGEEQGYPGKIVLALKKYGYSVNILCSDVFPDGKKIKERESVWNGIKIKRFKNYFNVSYFVKLFFPDVSNYDIIHCCGGYRHPHVFYSFLKRGKAKFLISPFYPMHNRGLVKNFFVNFVDYTFGGYLLRNADYCLAETNIEKKWLNNLGVSNVKIIPASIPDEYFESVKSNFKLKHNIKGKIVFWLGRHIDIKNIGELIKAVPYVNATFVFGGKETKVTSKWKAVAKKLGVEDKIIWLNDALNGKKKLEAYAACDVFALTSKKEGLGGVLLEAMAQKKPVIASNVGGLADVVPEKFCLYRPGDIDELAAKINLILNNKRLNKSLANKGYKKARDFMFSKVAKDYTILIKKCAE